MPNESKGCRPQNPGKFLELWHQVPLKREESMTENRRAGKQFVLRAPGFQITPHPTQSGCSYRESLLICSHKEWKRSLKVRALWLTLMGPTSAHLLPSPSWWCDGFVSSKHGGSFQGRKKGKRDESSPRCSCPLVPGKQCFPRNHPSPAKLCW